MRPYVTFHRVTLPTFWLGAFGLTAALAASEPQAPERLRFVYLFSGEPAAHLAASLTDPRTAVTTRVELGADGTLPLPEGGGSLELRDPRSGLVLFSASSLADFDEPADGVVRLPLPVRVIGRVEGFSDDPAEIEIHHGSGARISVSDFERREHGLLFLPFAEENRAWGLELPTIASRWRIERPRADRSFDSGWIALTAAPQLVVADRAGRLATLEVPLPAENSKHAVLAAGTVTPQPSTAIELDRTDLPATDLPLVLQAGLEAAAAVPGAEAETALRLALLNRLHPRTAHFALRRGEIPLSLGGVTRIAGLPPFTALDLYVTGPLPGIRMRRSLALPEGGSARFRLAAFDLLGVPRRIPLRGRVHFADGEPIADATVVYSSYPDRRETRTDAAGRFAFPAVAAGRSAVL